MISVVRFIGRRIFIRSIPRSRWARRFLFALAIIRWFRRSDEQYDIRLRRDEHIDVVIAKNGLVKK